MAASRADKSARSSPCSGSSSWTCRNAVAFPPAEADEERHGTGGRREPGRLRVEADQRHVRRRLAGQRRKPHAIDRQRPAGRLAPDDDALGRADDLAIDRFGEAHGEVDGASAAPAAGAAAASPRSPPDSGRAAGRASRPSITDAGQAAAARTVRPELGQQPQGQRPGIDVRLRDAARCTTGSPRRSRTRR